MKRLKNRGNVRKSWRFDNSASKSSEFIEAGLIVSVVGCSTCTASCNNQVRSERWR